MDSASSKVWSGTVNLKSKAEAGFVWMEYVDRRRVASVMYRLVAAVILGKETYLHEIVS